MRAEREIGDKTQKCRDSQILSKQQVTKNMLQKEINCENTKKGKPGTNYVNYSIQCMICCTITSINTVEFMCCGFGSRFFFFSSFEYRLSLQFDGDFTKQKQTENTTKKYKKNTPFTNILFFLSSRFGSIHGST